MKDSLDDCLSTKIRVTETPTPDLLSTAIPKTELPTTQTPATDIQQDTLSSPCAENGVTCPSIAREMYQTLIRWRLPSKVAVNGSKQPRHVGGSTRIGQASTGNATRQSTLTISTGRQQVQTAERSKHLYFRSSYKVQVKFVRTWAIAVCKRFFPLRSHY